MDTLNKVMDMKEVIKKYVKDGALIFFGGFGNCSVFAVAHEIIRQKKRNLKITRCAGGVMFDQLIGAGVTDYVITSHCWDGIGPQPAWNLKRAMEKKIPQPIIYHEYSLFSLNMSYLAGYLNIPFMPIRSLIGTDIYTMPDSIKNKFGMVKSPFSDDKICVVPPIRPDVGFIHVQRSDKNGNSQIWGLIGDIKFGINACKKIIVITEEIVDQNVIREIPNLTIVPRFRVSAVVNEPFGGHPGNVQGFYYTDLEYLLEYAKETKDIDLWEKWLEKWVFGVENRQEYLKVLGNERINKLKSTPKIGSGLNFGA
ncbi:MAG: CoA transferase subunit A [Candidatus Helarchaeota archaeon]